MRALLPGILIAILAGAAGGAEPAGNGEAEKKSAGKPTAAPENPAP